MSSLKIVSQDAAGVMKACIATVITASFFIACVGAAAFLSYVFLGDLAHGLSYLQATLSLRAIPMSDSVRIVATFINWAMLIAIMLFIALQATRVYFESVVDRSHVAKLQAAARENIRKRQLHREADRVEDAPRAANS